MKAPKRDNVYMNGVNVTNKIIIIIFVISPRANRNETLTARNDDILHRTP